MTFSAAALGGLVAAAVVYVVPDLVHLARDDKFAWNWRRFLRKLPICLAYTLIAGTAAAYLMHNPSSGAAFGYGFGIQSAIKGVMSTGQELSDELRTADPLTRA